MKERPVTRRGSRAGVLVLASSLLGGAGSGLVGLCGPFTDTAADAFCPSVLEILLLGITTGTTPTTYSPGDNVTRLQMSAFLSRAVDRVLLRGSRRAIADRFWTPQSASSLGMTTLLVFPQAIASDGADVWVAGKVAGTVSRVRASDGKLLDTWTDAVSASGVVAGPLGKVFATGAVSMAPGRLYEVNPAAPAGAVTTVASNLGGGPATVAFDGARFWTANNVEPSVSIVTPGAVIPWMVTTVTAGFAGPTGILYDTASIWISDQTAGTLLKLDSAGAILMTVTVGAAPLVPVFDGTNIWVPNNGSSTVSVVRASSGAVLTTLTGNGLGGPAFAAFDGERVLVTSVSGKAISLWKAADLSPLGSVPLAAGAIGACSDGLDFWVGLVSGQLARF